MFACGAQKNKVENSQKLFEEIRDIKSLKLDIKLNDFKLNFDENYGDWRTNLNEKPICDEGVEKKRENIKLLKEQSKELDLEFEKLEQEYLAKISKLLIMAQIHCEIKTDINYLFDEMGVSHDIEE